MRSSLELIVGCSRNAPLLFGKRFLGTYPYLRQQQLQKPREPIATIEPLSQSSIPKSSSFAEQPIIPLILPTITAKRTSLLNPADHTVDHEGFYYSVPQDQYDRNMGSRTFREMFRKDVKTFGECSIMIRSPGLEIINYIKRTNFSIPVVRYVLFGRAGVGKSATLAYLVHYFLLNGWVVLHVPSVTHWNNQVKEVQESTFKPGRIDLPLDSVDWLQHFLLQNGDLLRGSPGSPSNLKTHQKYIWSKREETPENSPLLDIVELGIKRARYANDCIGVIVKELKVLAAETNTKVAVVVDAVNALWAPTTTRKAGAGRKTMLAPEALSLFTHFKSALKNDWTNGAVITSVDLLGIPDEPVRKDDSGNHFPQYLLRKAGWEAMDPFIPICVPDYNLKEINNCIDYYLEKRWITHELGGTQQAKDELRFVSGMNPENLAQIVSRL